MCAIGHPLCYNATPDKLFNGAALNTNEIKRRIANQVVDQTKFGKKWKLKPKDGDEFTGQLFRTWSKAMGASAKSFLERKQEEIAEGVFKEISHDPKDAHRQIDLKAEAQLMRWAAGAGLEANCLPFQGNVFDKRDKDWTSRAKRAAKAAQFNIKANAEASFALGEAKVETIGYYPHFAGWHLMPAGAGVAIDLGHYRFRGDMALYAVAGASVALEASVALMVTANKQGLRGVPKDKKAVKAKVNASGEAKIFAGLKEGIDLEGALQWLNPEGFIDDKSPKRKDPKNTWGEYVNIASVGAGVAAIQGLAANLGVEVGYSNGNFVIAAKAGACLGLGGSGNVAGKVGVDQIGQMFMCVAHQLKQADYTKLKELMDEPIFKALNQVMYMVVAGQTTLADFVRHAERRLKDATAVGEYYDDAVDAIAGQGAAFIRRLEQSLKSKWGWFAYMPPESRGAILASLSSTMNRADLAYDTDLRYSAAFCVNELIRTAQTESHLANTLDRLTTNIGDVPGRGSGLASIMAMVSGSQFAGCIALTETQLAKASPVMHRPFMRNDEPEFQVAMLPLHHPASQA